MSASAATQLCRMSWRRSAETRPWQFQVATRTVVCGGGGGAVWERAAAAVEVCLFSLRSALRFESISKGRFESIANS